MGVGVHLSIVLILGEGAKHQHSAFNLNNEGIFTILLLKLECCCLLLFRRGPEATFLYKARLVMNKADKDPLK